MEKEIKAVKRYSYGTHLRKREGRLDLSLKRLSLLKKRRKRPEGSTSSLQGLRGEGTFTAFPLGGINVKKNHMGKSSRSGVLFSPGGGKFRL